MLNNNLLQWLYQKNLKIFTSTFEIFKHLNLISNINPVFKEQIINNLDDLKNAVYEFCVPLNSDYTSLLTNFYTFLFCHLMIKKRSLNEIKKSSYKFLINDLILFNSFKRTFYYDFLDEFKQFPCYNVFLIKLLKRVL
ncbi:hypothetical protein BCF59_0662 [Mycoplasmopsis mustelae]|uniref:N-terminal Ras-GEF domain-containing protein n=1 Tax=Mycoplasmopsis mustelae TaxID=171289 RepID=A0A4R7UCR5_9BACT|nr:hypothetical protein [Mycoplasmopsis mustelae]TDV23039.1 hypothetical protein BCF59_0662 [Mycoplasmopsis mustelae]